MIFVSFSKCANAVKDNLAIRKLTIKFATRKSPHTYFLESVNCKPFIESRQISKSKGYNPDAHAECIFISIFLEQDNAQA